MNITPLCGKYQHYKSGKLYEVIGVANHSETLEELIVYKALYQSDQFGENHMWVRPRQMFFEELLYNGTMVERFKYVEDSSPNLSP